MSSSSSDENPFSGGESNPLGKGDHANPFSDDDGSNPFRSSQQDNPFLPPVLPPGQIGSDLNQQPISFTQGYKISLAVAALLCILFLVGGLEMIGFSIFGGICAVMGAMHKPLRIWRRRRFGLAHLPAQVTAPDFWLSSLLSFAIIMAGTPVFFTVCTITGFSLDAVSPSMGGDVFLNAMIFSGCITTLVIFFLYFLTLRI
jgi:hypothetical protein